jgi:hypothetical protein
MVKTAVINKFQGSKGWLWFWIFMCWPIAIAYYFIKTQPVEVEVKPDRFKN